MPNKRIRDAAVTICVVCVVAALVFPLLWMLSTSFKAPADVFADDGLLPRTPTIENFVYALERVPLARYLMNSLLVAVVVSVGQLATALVAAYAFALMSFPGRSVLFILVLGAMLVPIQVLLIPNYLLVSELGWLDTYQGIALPQFVQAIAVFLLRQHIRAFPRALIDASRIDGASDWQILWRIVVPPTAPAIAAMGITLFLFSWNEYLWPLLVATDPAMLLVQVGIQTFASSEAGARYGPLMAAAALASLPPLLLYLILQRRIQQSFVAAGIKG